MKITDIRITGLSGGTVDGGWPDGMKPEEDLNTILEVISDEGLVGVGSVYTSKALTDAAARTHRPIVVLVDERNHIRRADATEVAGPATAMKDC